MSASLRSTTARVLKEVKDLLIGQIGIPTQYPFRDKILLRTYGGAVNLNNANETWSDNCSIEVEVLSEGAEISVRAE